MEGQCLFHQDWEAPDIPDRGEAPEGWPCPSEGLQSQKPARPTMRIFSLTTEADGRPQFSGVSRCEEAVSDGREEHSIRFINSSYDTLFGIPDGETVEVQFPDRKFTARCKYLDDYHTVVGNSVFHICEFAEHLEAQNGSVRPEPEITAEQAAWQLGHREYLALQRTDSGFDYTIYSEGFELKDGGQLDAPSSP